MTEVAEITAPKVLKMQLEITPTLKAFLISEKQDAIHRATARANVKEIQRATTELNRFLNRTKHIALPSQYGMQASHN